MPPMAVRLAETAESDLNSQAMPDYISKDREVAKQILADAVSCLNGIRDVLGFICVLSLFPRTRNRSSHRNSSAITEAVKGKAAVFCIAAGIVNAIDQQEHMPILCAQSTDPVGRGGADGRSHSRIAAFGKIVSDGGEPLNDGDYDNSHATKYIKRVTDLANLEASNELFAHLVDEAHKRGIKVIIDGVFNHCGSFNKWLDRERIYEGSEDFATGAFVSGESPYRDFFQFNDKNAWPNNWTYNGWWGHDTLPKLNYEGSKELEEYILNIARKWVSPPYNVDGWRLDVAADLGFSEEYNHKFWKKFRATVKEANPNAVILAEHYGDCNAWLQGDEWDTIMNYDAFMEPLTWFLTGMEKHSDSFRYDQIGNPSWFFDAMRHNMSRMGGSPTRIAMNELSNHDHSRFLTRTNRTVGRTASRGPKAAEENINKAIFKEAVVIQMTWPGAPTVYYGDEAGVCGWTDPDNRRTYPWGHEDMDLVNFHKAIIDIHKKTPALNTGSYKRLYGDYNIIAYGRFLKDSKAITIVNNNDTEKTIDINVWELGIKEEDVLRQAILTSRDGFEVNCGEYTNVDGKMKITLPPQSGTILIK